MYEAQMLISQGSTTKTPVYSPWMKRGGDYLRATAEYLEGTGTLTVEVATKNNEDTGDGSVIAGTSISLIEAGRTTEQWGELKELVRYKITAGGTSGQWIILRMLEPVWFDAVDA